MKRTNRGGGGPEMSKRHRNADTYAEALAEGKFELRFLIPSKCAGAVIGKSGDKIKSVRDKFNAVLTVPDKSTPERVFTMVVSQESLADCFREVLSNLADFKEMKNKREEFEVRILIHQSMAGAIIGKGGDKIKELREQTGANLKVFSECAPLSSDRVLLISTSQDKIPDVVKQMVDFMKEIPIKGVVKQYDASNYDPRAASSYGGYAGNDMPPNSNGFGGPRMPRGGGNIDPFESGRNPPFEQVRQPNYPSQAPYGGGAPGGGYNDYGARQPYAGGPSNYGGNASFGPGAPRGGPPPPLGNSSYDVTTTQVTIPDELAGTIIGKGGERINRIRQESGARIDIGQSMYGTNERIITITGTGHQIQSAQYHLQQSVRSSEAGRRYLSQQQR